MIALALATRHKLPITGLFIREDEVYYYTEERGAICKWNKAWYHR